MFALAQRDRRICPFEIISKSLEDREILSTFSGIVIASTRKNKSGTGNFELSKDIGLAYEDVKDATRYH